MDVSATDTTFDKTTILDFTEYCTSQKNIKVILTTSPGGGTESGAKDIPH